jgi:hypothetical protein
MSFSNQRRRIILPTEKYKIKDTKSLDNQANQFQRLHEHIGLMV